MPVNDRTPTPQETQALDEVGAVGLGHLFCCTGRTNPNFQQSDDSESGSDTPEYGDERLQLYNHVDAQQQRIEKQIIFVSRCTKFAILF